jgi:hypothetical protein
LGQNTKVSDVNEIARVELLGQGGVEFKREADRLVIQLPERLPNDWALAFKITVNGKLLQRKLEGKNKVIPMKT